MSQLVRQLNKLWNYHIDEFVGETSEQSQTFFDEIVKYYTQSHRKYHNLNHLNELFIILDEINLSDEAVIWSIWYHDFIYDIPGPDNELNSAIIAKDRLLKLNISESIVNKVYDYIIATQTHKS